MTRRRDKKKGSRPANRHKQGQGRPGPARERPAPAQAPGPGPWYDRFRFRPANYLAFAAGLGAIVAGYVQLDDGSVTGAPLLLILGYAVLLPLGLVLGWRRLG